MQKTKSLLVKILVFMCVICCSVALMLGLTGCAKDGLNGEPGAPGADGVSIESAEVDADGNLIITLTDGSKINAGNVKGPQGIPGLPGEPGQDATPVECEHTFYEIQTEVATCQKEGVKVKICTKDGGCGHAYVEKTAIDPNNHVDFDVTTVEATCTAEGYTSKVCACGYETGKTNIVPAKGHNYVSVTTQPTCEDDGYITDTCSRCGDVKTTAATDANGLKATGHDAVGTPVTVVDEGANICEDGGQRLIVCKTCFTSCTDCEGMIYEAEEIVAEGHNITSAWTVTTKPTKDTAGSIAGYCDVCGTNATVALPALNKTDYVWAETVIPTCITEGEETYTFVYFGNEVTVIDCTFEVVTKTAHKYGTVALNTSFAYDELVAIFGASNIGSTDNYACRVQIDAAWNCQQKTIASTSCTECGSIVYFEATGNHDYEKTNTVAPTCTTDGYDVLTCKIEGCGHVNNSTGIVSKTGHNYDLSESLSDFANGKLVFVCSNNAEHTDEITAYEFEIVDNPASCTSAGEKYVVYSYIDQNNVDHKDVKKVLATYEINSDHKYGNVIIKGSLTYDELVEIFGASNIGSTDNYDCRVQIDATWNCQQKTIASTSCTACGSIVYFEATGNHDYEKTNTVAPTCTTDGYDVLTCKIEGCGHVNNSTGIVSKTGHNYDLSESLSDFANGKLVFVCSNNAEHTDEITAYEFEIFDVPASCTSTGEKYVVYSYIDQNNVDHKDVKKVLATYEINSDHKYGNVIIKDSLTYDELVDIFGASNIGSTDNYACRVQIDATWNCQQKTTASTSCTECGSIVYFEATGNHVWTSSANNGWIKVEETCTEGAYEYRDCSVCSEHEENVLVAEPATGHTYEFAVVDATESAAGSLTITCEDCDYEEVIVLPALSAANGYVVSVDVPNSCASEGVTTYTLKVEYADSLLYTYTISVTTPVIDHVDAEPPVETTWVYNGYTYTGYYCGSCEQIIVTSKTEITE